MPQFDVRITTDYIQRMVKVSPVEALEELIWNALDADATLVKVRFERNMLDGIDEIYIADNGHGIELENIKITFGNLGQSLKKNKDKTKLGRGYHGRNGQGRYKALSIGSQVKWESTYESPAGERQYFAIECQSDKPKTFVYTDAVPTSQETGVTVIIEGISNKVSGVLSQRNMLVDAMVKKFAPYLLAYKDIELMVDGARVRPEAFIINILEKEVEINHEEQLINASIKLIHWKEGSGSRLHYCSDKGVSLFESGIYSKFGNLPIAIYVQSPYIDELTKQGTLEFEDMQSGLDALKSRVREILNDYSSDWMTKSAAMAVMDLKNDDVYPYKGEPQGIAEEVERKVFDLCTFTIHKAMPEFRKVPSSQKRLTLRLLKEALRNRPEHLDQVLTEVLDLKDEQVRDLADILKRTSLAAVISTAKLVSDRLRFLNALNQIVYDPAISPLVKERSQLHKILLEELWVFGEQYVYGCDDQRLSNVLKQYVEHLGRDKLVPDINPEKLKSLTDIPDICLWSQHGLGQEDSVENLVVELKRPKVKLGLKELNQVTQYAEAVADHELFPKDKTKWTFLLIGGELDTTAKFSMKDKNNDCFYETKEVSIYVKNWGQLINENLAKHRYLQKQLNLDSTDNQEGISYLQEKYNRLLPDVIALAETAENYR